MAQGGPIHRRKTRRAVQTPRRASSSHSEASLSGHELAGIRRGTEAAGQFDHLILRRGDRGVAGGATEGQGGTEQGGPDRTLTADRHLKAKGVSAKAAAGCAYCGKGAWVKSNRPAMTRAYSPSWFNGRMKSLKALWQGLNSPPVSAQLSLGI